MSKCISFIVCENGLGHLKRVLSVIDELISRDKELSIHLFYQDSAELFARKFDVKHVHQINFDSSISGLEVPWLRPTEYNLSDYELYKQRLENHSVLKSSDLIISDNQILPAIVFKKCILMGSFLWPFTVPNLPENLEEISVIEKTWLKYTNRICISLADFVMPEIKEFLHLVPMPWFTDRVEDVTFKDNKENVLIASGGTGILKDEMLELARELKTLEPNLKISLDRTLYHLSSQLKLKGFDKFDYSHKSFNDLRCIICRPGIGIITDAVKYKKPLVGLYDLQNSEIAYNSRKLTDLALGMALNLDELQINEIALLIDENLKNDRNIKKFKENLSKQRVSGAKITAEFLIQLVNDEHTEYLL